MPERAANHVQHRTTLFVEVTIEEFGGIAIDALDNRAPVLLGFFLEIRRDGFEHVIDVFVPAELRFPPDAFAIRCEAFVEPRMRPITCRKEIAEPLVREFVRDEPIARIIEMRAFVVQGEIGLRRCGGIFHAAHRKVGDGDLPVPCERVRHTGKCSKRAHHLGRGAETSLALIPAALGNVIEHRNICSRLFDFFELADYEREQIRRVRNGLIVNKCRRFAVVAPLE